jgi:hypothetical protein
LIPEQPEQILSLKWTQLLKTKKQMRISKRNKDESEQDRRQSSLENADLKKSEQLLVVISITTKTPIFPSFKN